MTTLVLNSLNNQFSFAAYLSGICLLLSSHLSAADVGVSRLFVDKKPLKIIKRNETIIAFDVKNISNHTIQIMKIEPGCLCVPGSKVKFKEVLLQPQASFNIEAEFDSKTPHESVYAKFAVQYLYDNELKTEIIGKLIHAESALLVDADNLSKNPVANVISFNNTIKKISLDRLPRFISYDVNKLDDTKFNILFDVDYSSAYKNVDVYKVSVNPNNNEEFVSTVKEFKIEPPKASFKTNATKLFHTLDDDKEGIVIPFTGDDIDGKDISYNINFVNSDYQVIKKLESKLVRNMSDKTFEIVIPQSDILDYWEVNNPNKGNVMPLTFEVVFKTESSRDELYFFKAILYKG